MADSLNIDLAVTSLSGSIFKIKMFFEEHFFALELINYLLNAVDFGARGTSIDSNDRGTKI
jgi:hypothetical protein